MTAVRYDLAPPCQLRYLTRLARHRYSVTKPKKPRQNRDRHKCQQCPPKLVVDYEPDDPASIHVSIVEAGEESSDDGCECDSVTCRPRRLLSEQLREKQRPC